MDGRKTHDTKDAGILNANIVFDLDGTLIDSAPDIHGIANTLLLERGLDPVDIPTVRSFIGRGAPSFIAQLCAVRGIPEQDQPRLLNEFLERYDDAVTLTHPYPGVDEALSRLVETNRLGLCTNKPYRPCLSILGHLKLDRYFTVVIGGDSLPARKPDPLPLLATFDRMGPGRRIYIGDSETDAEAAQRAGIPFVLFSGGYRKASVADLPLAALFREFRDLPAIVLDLLARTPE